MDTHDVKDIESLELLSDVELKEVMCKKPWKISHITEKRKTEDICLAAVTSDGDVLQFIPNASYDVIKAAIVSDPFAVQWVEKLPLELLLLGISMQPSVIKYVTNPPIEAIAAAIFKEPALEDHFEDYQLQLASDYINSVLIKEAKQNAESKSI